ncbi:hypothetical protein JCM11251_003625 [Rhodosporidiobolus azoricus]
MPFSALPRELHAEIVRLVDEQDRKSRGRGYSELAVFRGGLGSTWYGKGVKALSLVSKDLRSLTLPYIFCPLKFARLPYDGLAALPTTEIGQICRAVLVRPARTSYVSSGWIRDHEALQAVLAIIDKLPRVRQVDLSECSYDLSRLLRRLELLSLDDERRRHESANSGKLSRRHLQTTPPDVSTGAHLTARSDDAGSSDGEDIANASDGSDYVDGVDSADDYDEDADEPRCNPTMIARLSFRAEHITAWNLRGLQPEIALAFIELAPSSVQTLSIDDYMREKPSSSPFAMNATTFCTRLASLPNLTTFSLYGREEAPGFVDLDCAINLAWSNVTFSSPSSLTTLSLSFGIYTNASHRLIAGLAASLTSLTIDCADVETTPIRAPVHLPLLRHFSLISSGFTFAAEIASKLRPPYLQTLELSLSCPPEDTPQGHLRLHSFFLKKSSILKQAAKSLRIVRLSAHHHTRSWSPAMASEFVDLVHLRTESSIPVETTWSSARQLTAPPIEVEQSLQEVCALADWM